VGGEFGRRPSTKIGCVEIACRRHAFDAREQLRGIVNIIVR
jgi:hypothetical protein